MEHLDTPRLHLRPLAAGDEALYRALYTDPGVMAHVGRPLDGQAVRRAFLAACRRSGGADPLDRLWVVECHGDRRAIGLLALRRTSSDGDGVRATEIGVMLLPASQGRGIARELNAAALDLAFRHDAGLERVVARHARGNRAAAVALAASGFEPDGGDGGETTCVVTRARWDASRPPAGRA